MGKVVTFSLPIRPLKQSPRKIWVYLPDSYAKSKKKYDVLYMFDGHNLFFDDVATYGKSWGIKDYLDETGLDLVVVGQDCNHTGDMRLYEYCPLPAVKTKWLEEIDEPLGDVTAEWFVKVLKKECEKRFRIYKTRDHVGIAGSSMGGLMAEYCIARYNKVFSKAACVSPAHYFCAGPLRELIEKTSFQDSRIYIDLGEKEPGTKKLLGMAVQMMLEFSHLYAEKGCQVYPYLVPDGTHSEASWEKIVPLFLQYLYPHLYH